MRLFLDECLPHDLARALSAHHSVKTADDMGWNGIQNGRLLKALRESGEFDVFVTADKSLPHQQNLRDIPFAIVVLRLRSTRVANVLARVPSLLQHLPLARAGEVSVVPSTD